MGGCMSGDDIGGCMDGDASDGEAMGGPCGVYEFRPGDDMALWRDPGRGLLTIGRSSKKPDFGLS